MTYQVQFLRGLSAHGFLEIVMNIFESARIRLTLWYLLIIMTVSLSFSAFIYRSVTNEFARRLDTIEERLELRRQLGPLPAGQARYFAQDIKDVRGVVLIILFYTNGVILIFSFAAGYILAGKTLAPIEDALNDQKRFVADASHELKTPLAALQVSTEVVLRNKKLTKQQAISALRENLFEIEKIKDLINNLLLLAKTNGGSRKTHEVFSSIAFSTVIPMFKKLAKEKRIRLISKITKTKLKANKDSLLQMASLLLDNAIKYTPKSGQVKFVVTKNTRYLKIVVQDTGIGIADLDKERVFSRFYRVDSSRSKTIDGFGLGLSIVQKIVTEHNGKIKVDSSKGKGSTFTVQIPLNL